MLEESREKQEYKYSFVGTIVSEKWFRTIWLIGARAISVVSVKQEHKYSFVGTIVSEKLEIMISNLLVDRKWRHINCFCYTRTQIQLLGTIVFENLEIMISKLWLIGTGAISVVFVRQEH